MSNEFALTFPPEMIEAIAAQVAERIFEAQEPKAEPYLTRAQAAEYLACAPKRISELTEREAIRFYADGSRKLYRRSDLDEYLSGSGASLTASKGRA